MTVTKTIHYGGVIERGIEEATLEQSESLSEEGIFELRRE